MNFVNYYRGVAIEVHFSLPPPYTALMDAKFWLERWKQKEIGFHKKEVNPALLAVHHQFNLTPGQTCLVPLCGKSVDLLWFARQGLKVVGVELSSFACEEFFHENKIDFKKKSVGKFEIYYTSQIELWCGDFFEFSTSESFDLIYDRASNIALPPEMRKAYYHHMHQFFSKKTRLCLIAVEYNQALIEGPPFSVSEEEIQKYYGAFTIKKLSDTQVLMDNKRFEEVRVTTREKIYWISKNSG